MNFKIPSYKRPEFDSIFKNHLLLNKIQVSGEQIRYDNDSESGQMIITINPKILELFPKDAIDELNDVK